MNEQKIQIFRVGIAIIKSCFSVGHIFSQRASLWWNSPMRENNYPFGVVEMHRSRMSQVFTNLFRVMSCSRPCVNTHTHTHTHISWMQAFGQKWTLKEKDINMHSAHVWGCRPSSNSSTAVGRLEAYSCRFCYWRFGERVRLGRIVNFSVSSSWYIK